MAKQYYLPAGDAQKNLWLKNFATKLPNYASRYNIDAADITDVQNSSADFDYRVNMANQWRNYATKWTAYKNELRDGIAANATASGAPVPPNVPGLHPAVAPGIFNRITAIVARIKASGAYTDADGQDLGIIGAEKTTDYTTLKPHASIRTGSGGVPEIVWDKQDMDGIAVYKDSGSGFMFYDLDNHPNYQDKHPLPTGAQSVIWRYKIIYRENDVEVGQWSDVMSMSVGS
ncbi:hypothetical protein ACTHGU_10435 [Chitinophagaceae bacterium MMS25-I14]